MKNTSPYSITKDQVDKVTFRPVTTKAMKLEVRLPEKHAAGLYEWSVD